MNKRFSTLLATVLVAGGLSANAQTPLTGSAVTTELYSTPARNYMLATQSYTTGNGIANVVTVNRTGMWLENAASPATTGAGLDAQLWTIQVKAVSGSNRYILTNKATGLTLSFDPSKAIAADASGVVTLPTDATALENASSRACFTVYFTSPFNVFAPISIGKDNIRIDIIRTVIILFFIVVV